MDCFHGDERETSPDEQLEQMFYDALDAYYNSVYATYSVLRSRGYPVKVAWQCAEYEAGEKPVRYRDGA